MYGSENELSLLSKLVHAYCQHQHLVRGRCCGVAKTENKTHFSLSDADAAIDKVHDDTQHSLPRFLPFPPNVTLDAADAEKRLTPLRPPQNPFVRPDPPFYVFILELFSSTLSSPSCIIELPIALPRSAHKNQQLSAFMP